MSIPENILDVLTRYLNERVYYDDHGSCKLGTLCGVKYLNNEFYYIVENNGVEDYVSEWKSLTRL